MLLDFGIKVVLSLLLHLGLMVGLLLFQSLLGLLLSLDNIISLINFGLIGLDPLGQLVKREERPDGLMEVKVIKVG